MFFFMGVTCLLIDFLEIFSEFDFEQFDIEKAAYFIFLTFVFRVSSPVVSGVLSSLFSYVWRLPLSCSSLLPDNVPVQRRRYAARWNRF
jgi:hypothetical protein